MVSKIQSVAENTKGRIRDALHAMAAKMDADGRNYSGLDHTVYIMYAIECFMRALSRSPNGKEFALKGGNLFRVWDEMTSFRPTGDLDLQCNRTDEIDIINIKQEIAEIVGTREFQEKTGLVFQLDQFNIERLENGQFRTYRMDGAAILGDESSPNAHVSRIPFCLEILYGPIPEDAVTLEKWESILTDGESFDIIASRPEWMAAEKFHSIVTRGMANSRLKDYRDLCALLSFRGFSTTAFRDFIQDVFAQFGQAHLIPEHRNMVIGLTDAFATQANDHLWRGRRWKEWNGRAWDRDRDPDLMEVIVQIVAELERRGVFSETPGRHVAGSMALLAKLVGHIEAGETHPGLLHTIKFVLIDLAAHANNAPPKEVSWFWRGSAKKVGMAGSHPAEAYAKIASSLQRLRTVEAIDRLTGAEPGSTSALLDKVGATLGTAAIPSAVEINPDEESGLKSPKRRGRRAQERKSEENQLEECLTMLKEGKPGTHIWFGGLIRLLNLKDRALHETSPGVSLGGIGEVELVMPEDKRTSYVWLQIAKKNGLEENLEVAVELGRNILATMASHDVVVQPVRR